MTPFRGAQAAPGEPPVFWQVVTVRDGQVARLRDFTDRDVALAAAGLDPTGG